MSEPRVVVVGGGVIGLSCAYYLAKGGASVVLVERDAIGSGASSGNAGTISAGHPPLNRPGRIAQAVRQMLDPSSPLYVRPSWNPGLWAWLARFAKYCTEDHVRTAMGVMAPLGRDALALFDELLRAERIDCEYRREGYFDVCATQDGLAAARHEAAVIEAAGYHPEVIDGDELRRREPELSPDLPGGVYYPEAATLEPAKFLRRLARVADRLGVVTELGFEVSDVTTHAGAASGVRDRSGRVIDADAVVLATGPFSLALARRFGRRLPIQPGKGYHRDVPVGPNGAPRMRVACVLSETSVFCTPMDTVLRLAGTMEFSGENTVMRPARLRQLTVAARAALPGLGPARPVSEWCGLRPMSVDGLPIVGPIGGVARLVVATGHGMLGLTLGPVTGQIVAHHLLEGGDDRLAALSPERFD